MCSFVRLDLVVLHRAFFLSSFDFGFQGSDRDSTSKLSKMGFTTAYFDTVHQLTNGCSQLSPEDLREFLAYLKVENVEKFNVEKISWCVPCYSKLFKSLNL